MFSRTIASIMAAGVFLSGCSTINSQISGRTATEQYLVTASVDRAVNAVANWDRLQGEKIHLDLVGVQVTEHEYIKAVLKKAFLKVKAVPVSDVEDADVSMTVLVHSIGTDVWLSNFGIPLFFGATPGLPGNFSGISLYNSNLQEGYCRMEFFGTDPKTDRLIWRSNPVVGNSYFKTQTFLGAFGPFKSGDIYPEKNLLRPKGYQAEK
jgi:uncharacterized protein YceK